MSSLLSATLTGQLRASNNLTMDHPHFDNCSRRSSPIEIPHRRRPVSTCPPQFSTEQSQSPDMIFEMSPIMSNFHSPQSTLTPSPLRNPYDNEPFLYCFPALKTRNVNMTNRSHATPPRRHEIPVSHTFAPTKQGHRRQRKTNGHEGDENAPAFPCACGGTTSSKKTTTTRIVGFSPIKPPGFGQRNSAQVSSTQESLPTHTGRSYFPWSPWILPGMNNNRGEDFLSIDANSGPMGFGDYLLHRTESAEHLFNDLQLVPSMRV